MGNLVVLDKDTGEVIFDLDGYHIVKDRSDFSLIHFKEANDNFAKLSQEAIPAICQALSPSEVRFFFFCIQFLSYGDCALREGGHGNGKLLTSSDLARASGYNKYTISHLLGKLCSIGLATKMTVDDTEKIAIVLNPFCVFKGSQIKVKVYNHFVEAQKKKER